MLYTSFPDDEKFKQGRSVLEKVGVDQYQYMLSHVALVELREEDACNRNESNRDNEFHMYDLL